MATLWFNQVSPDQSPERMNATDKKGGRIVGITKIDTALDRWDLSYNMRSHADFCYENVCKSEETLRFYTGFGSVPKFNNFRELVNPGDRKSVV